MAGQFYLSLVNPVLAISFGIVVALLWRRWPSRAYLFPLSLAFLYVGLAFVTHIVPLLSRPGTINYAGNALFFAAVVLACSSALMRAGVAVPVRLFAAITAVAVLGFSWFALITPSMLSRIYLLNGCFLGLTGSTAFLLLRASKTLADRLFVAGVALGGLLAASRPLAILFGVLPIAPEADIQESGYWASILGLTPILSVLVISLFVFALVLDIFAGLQREADGDFLTGMLNRRGFDLSASDRLRLFTGAQIPPALLVADIDDFKQINDQFGHSVGDSVIAAVGRVLSQHGRADLAGRIGGEEFALFYDMGSRRMLENCAEAVRVALSELHIAGLPPGHRFTISIGLHVREAQENLADMMRRADRALYDAKAAGKNRAVLTPLLLRSA